VQDQKIDAAVLIGAWMRLKMIRLLLTGSQQQDKAKGG
jgi:hypothetical protein